MISVVGLDADIAWHVQAVSSQQMYCRNFGPAYMQNRGQCPWAHLFGVSLSFVIG